MNICSLLMDQSIIAGIGNVMKCEALHHVNVDPRKKTSDVGFANVLELFKIAQMFAKKMFLQVFGVL